MRPIVFLVVCVGLPWSLAYAADDEPNGTPKPIPASRPEIKNALEALKERQPRLPLPPAANDEPTVNNGRMRAYYLPESWTGGFTRRPTGQSVRGPWKDPNAKLDYALTRACFWVVSRGNNCHYCLGHQELALRWAGFDDDTIASLDNDWSRFDPRQQAALVYARRLTLEPHLVGDDDVAALKKLFSDAELIELTFNIARFNATNRWTDGLGIPQDRRFGEEENSLVTPTNEAFQNTVSVATPTTRVARPAQPTLDEIKEATAACRERKARIEMPAEEKAREALASVIGDRPAQNWELAMAQLPEVGPSQVRTLNTIMTDEHLPKRLKAEISLISAVQNRAWYAVGHAVDRLSNLGASMDEMGALFDPQSSAAATAAHRLAAKSTSDPHLITDADIARVREHYSDAETAQIMQVICVANMFDRFTEALGLPLEKGVADETSPLP